MSQKNEISIVIPPAEVVVINKLLSDLKQKIAPYIHALTADEIAGFIKMGDKSVAFVNKVKDYTISNPEFIPTDVMDVKEFNIDTDAVNVIAPVLKVVSQIESDLKDTFILCGSESFLASLIYYRNVRNKAAEGVASAKAIYEDLKKRYPGKGKKAATTPNV